MTADHPEEPTVPVSDLRAKVQIWRRMANDENTPEENSTTLRWCVDQVEELVAEYE